MESSRRDLFNDMAEHRSILKKNKIRIFPIFFMIDLRSATSMESSRRDLLNDMAEHMPILKNIQAPPPFWFHTPVQHPPKRYFVFTVLFHAQLFLFFFSKIFNIGNAFSQYPAI